MIDPPKYLETNAPKRSLKGRLLAGSASLLAARVIAICCGLIVFTFLTRTLGPVSYGVYGVAVVISQWFGILVDAIAGGATIQLVAGHEKGQRFAITILKVSLIAGLLIGVLLMLGAPWIAEALHAPEMALPLSIIAVDIPLQAMGMKYSQILTARGRFQHSAALTAGYWIARTLLSLSLVSSGAGILGATAALPLATILQTLAGHWMCKVRVFSNEAMPIKALYLNNRLRTINGLLYHLLQNMDLLTMRMWNGSLLLTGYYAAAKNLSLVATMLFSSGQSVVLSTLSKAHGEGKTVLRDRLGRGYLFISLYFSGLIISLSILAIKGVGIVLGPQYKDAGAVASILVAAVGIQLLSASTLNLVSARGERGSMAAILTFLVPLAFALYYWLPSSFAVVSITIGHATIFTFVIALMTLFAYQKMMHISKHRLPWKSFLSTGFAVFMSVLVMTSIDAYILPLSSLMTMGIHLIVGTLIYILILWLFEPEFKQLNPMLYSLLRMK